jgi:signal transduction histidine kinase
MRNTTTTLFFFFCSLFTLNAQDQLAIYKLEDQRIALNKGWKWQKGDQAAFAEPTFNDSNWKKFDPTKDIHDYPQLFDGEVRWLRMRFEVDQKPTTAIGLSVTQAGASEIYLNGKLVHKIGQVKSKASIAQDPLEYPFSLPIDAAGEYVLAVRYALQPHIHYTTVYGLTLNKVFDASLVNLVATQNEQREFRVYYTGMETFKIGVFAMLFILHFAFFLYQKNNKIQLFLSIFFLGTALQYVFKILGQNEVSVEARYYLINISFWLSNIGQLFGLAAMYQLTRIKRDFYFTVILVISAVMLIVSSLTYGRLWIPFSLVQALISFLITLRLSMLGVKKQLRGFKILTAAVMISSLGFVFIELVNLNIPVPGLLVDIIFNLSVIAIPIGFSLYMGLDASNQNKALSAKLVENEALKDQTIAQEQEKQQILAQQNETLENQVTERTAELAAKNKDLEIEAALDKIRTVSLAMKRSDEIEAVVSILYEKLKELGLVFDGGAAIHVFEEGSKDAAIWVVSPQQAPIRINLPYDKAAFVDNPIILDVWKAKETGQHIFNKNYSFEEKNRYFQYVFKHNDNNKIPEIGRNFILSVPGYTATFAAEQNSLLGANSWTGELFAASEFELLKRVAKVFEQAYTRSLDLQKAEAQAREAQIEVALERVRSRTMEMQKSQELREVVATIYDQLQNLGFTYGALGIVIMDETSGDMDWWMAGFGKEAYPENYYIPFFDHPFYLAQLNAWKEGKKFVVLEASGEQKKAYDEVIFSRTDFVRIPLQAQQIMLGFEKITFSNANMKHGALSWGTDPIDDIRAQILQRFAVVFEQTYTRFLDLQKKEEQAFNLAEEKQKLERTLSELRSTQAQLIQSEKLASLGELTAGIAHEIQNPLNFVNNFAEVSAELLGEMQEELDKGDTAEAKVIAADLVQNLQKINHHGQRASSIVKGMLEHSRASTGQKEPTDLNQMADEYLRLAYHGLRAKESGFNCQLEANLDPNLPKVAVIPQDIGRVLLNLINNALHAVQEKAKMAIEGYEPKVSVSSALVDGQVELQVQDNGMGIPEGIREKIFQPFFTTKPTGQGTGLGLSLAYDIVVKGHGGMLEVDTKEGRRTIFSVKLPL